MEIEPSTWLLKHWGRTVSENGRRNICRIASNISHQKGKDLIIKLTSKIQKRLLTVENKLD